MSDLSADNAAEWLLRQGWPVAGLRFVELGGGISNKVILAEGPEFRAVLKQSLGQLRTESGWYSDRERIFREAAVMRWLGGGLTPRILFEEPSTFTIAMEAAPAAAEMWKTRLFRGDMDDTPARRAGAALGAMIASSWHNPDAEGLFGDQTIFDQLRIGPYYRFTAARRPEAAGYIHDLIDRSAARRVSLVHGDWSPKNLLVDHDRLWAIDWEVIHYGDPGFDVGFLLNHLLLKSIAMPQHRAALAELARVFLESLTAHLPPGGGWILNAGLEHLPALLLARVSGKSPAEYLDSAMRDRAASLALDLMHNPPTDIDEVFAR